MTQLEYLSPQRPGTIDVYAVIVGGDGAESVFRREAVTVRNVLNKRFETQGRTVTLINHRSLPKPEATLNSLGYVLDRVAQTMDRNEDILYLHITTHGSENHVLSLTHPSVTLYGLNPPYLRALLDKSGIRYRVVFISACYSGGFVPILANPNTLVITSAGSNLQSSGCGEHSEITDYSRAFYLNALNQTRSLKQAARLAQQEIHNNERNARHKHSFPQMQIGAGIDLRLEELERQLLHQ